MIVIARPAFRLHSKLLFLCRERCFSNNLVMRHVGDRMIISPPLVITEDEIDTLVARARTALDETLVQLEEKGLMTKPS